MRACPVIICLLLPVALWAAPPAELANAGFESDADRDGLPDGWSRYVTYPGSARVAVDRDMKCGGASSLRIELADKSRCAISQLISVSDAGTYTFSAMVRMPSPPTTVVALQIQWFQTVEWPRRIRMIKADPASPAVGAAPDWMEIAATGTRPEGADLAQVVIIAGDAQTPAGTVWVDDARWRKGAFPAPLVTNPGFELDLNNDGIPDGWSRSMYGEGWDLGIDRTVAHTGQASARLTGAANHGDRSVFVQASPLFTPPNKVRLTFWYKGTGESRTIMHLLTPAGVEKPGGGIEYASFNGTPPLSDQWQQFSKELIVPQEAKDAGIMRVDILLYQRGEGTIWYDDVKLELLE